MEIAILISCVVCYVLTLISWLIVEAMRNNKK